MTETERKRVVRELGEIAGRDRHDLRAAHAVAEWLRGGAR